MHSAIAKDRLPTVATASLEVDKAIAAGKNCLLVAKAWYITAPAAKDDSKRYFLKDNMIRPWSSDQVHNCRE